MAFMIVPETAMHKDNGPELRKHEIRLARHFPRMQPVTKTVHVQRTPDNELWLGVLSPDPRHHPASDIGGNDISHAPAWARYARLLEPSVCRFQRGYAEP